MTRKPFHETALMDRPITYPQSPPSLTEMMMRCLCLFVCLLFPSVELYAQDNSTSSSMVPIFDGTSMSGWHGRPHMSPEEYEASTDAQRQQWMDEVAQHWTIQDGELVNDGEGPYLTTNRSYGDIELRLKYKTVSGADSGVYLRATPQVQIWDYTDPGKKDIGGNLGSGGLWNNSPGAPGKDPLTLADKPFEQWNDLRVVQVGARTTVYLNDELVVDHAIMENFWDRQLPLAKSGPIELQTHGGEIRWKDIQVRELTAEESNSILAAKNADGFESKFDGKSLRGWTGAIDDYEIVDGAIQCRDERGGNLYTEETFDNFVVRVEFKLPPAGNNGLAIRFPGQGDPAYVAFCELQVLDDTDPVYQSVDPRQRTGSAYGIAAAHPGYLRPVGDWNFEEVTVDGTRIRVELNGTVILDADLADVKEFMANSPHPGLSRTEGHFGFAGHTDPVQFRNVMIRPLTSVQ